MKIIQIQQTELQKEAHSSRLNVETIYWDTSWFYFLHIISLYYTELMIYILKGEQVYPAPLVWLRGFLLLYLRYFMCVRLLAGGICRSLCRLGPYALVCIRSWGGVRMLSGIRIYWRAYLKRLIPAPYSRCRRWTLILCIGYLIHLWLLLFEW